FSAYAANAAAAAQQAAAAESKEISQAAAAAQATPSQADLIGASLTSHIATELVAAAANSAAAAAANGGSDGAPTVPLLWPLRPSQIQWAIRCWRRPPWWPPMRCRPSPIATS